MLKLRKILLYDNLYRVTALIVLFLSLAVTLLPNYKSKYKGNENEFICLVKEYKIDGNKLEYNLKCKENLIGKYYFKSESEKENFTKEIKIGETLKLNGQLEEPINNTVPNSFNYKKYLYNKKIYYILNIEQIEKVHKKTPYLYKIKNLIYKRTNKIKNNEYLYAYILGKTYKIDEKIIESYRKNGISHLFALSGLHVSIFSILLMKILKKLKINEMKRYLIIFLFLILFSFITGFSPSILRASLLFFLLGINKVYYFHIKTINILYLVFIILSILNPFIIYNMSFLLSFSTTYFIILSSDLINDKNYLKGLLKVSSISFISNIGLSIYYFNTIYPLGIIMNLIFVPLVSFIIFPLTLIVFILPSLSFILSVLILIMEKLSLFLSTISIHINFPHINIYLLIFYYILLVLIITKKRKKYIIALIILVLFFKIYPYFNFSTRIYFIDVGQGDSQLIITKQNKKAILIDTGGKLTHKEENWKKTRTKYNLGTDTLIPLLKSLGVSKLDYIIITHGDFDHMGEAINLVENYKVEKVIFNCGKFNKLEKELIKVLEKRKIPYYSCIKKLNVDNNKLYFLNNKDYGNENDNSSVIYAKLNNYNFLFMGDAGIEVEKNLILKYNLQKIDLLKVGHHGSKTSSSNNFINEINPKYSIISVGKDNRYGHPNDSVLENLNKSKIYRTDQDGSIIFEIKNNKFNIKTYIP